jgi:hypothetical protein
MDELAAGKSIVFALAVAFLTNPGINVYWFREETSFKTQHSDYFLD